MREKITQYAARFLMVLLIPYCITAFFSGREIKKTQPSGYEIVTKEGKKMDMEEFLPYALAGQMDLTYESEALKAQAVIARTNILNKMTQKKTKILQIDQNEIAYCDEETLKENLGQRRYEQYLKKLSGAVKKTAGETIRCKNAYINALYHEISIGKTVSAKEILGKDLPYLKEVESSQDVEAKDYMMTTEVSFGEMRRRLGNDVKVKDMALPNWPQNIKVTKKTENGYVKELSIGDSKISGDRWKELFELPSTNFYIEDSEGKVRMIVLGKGHGMGLSQYGANVLAKENKTYIEILKYYYKGVQIKK